MNPYELSALEGKDLYCEHCGEYISLDEYIYNEGLCDICAEEILKVKTTQKGYLAVRVGAGQRF